MSKMAKADGEFTCRKCNLSFVPTFLFDFYQDGEDPEVGLCENCMMAKVFGSAPSGDPKPLPEGYQDAVCKFGQGSATCSFLAWGDGLVCLKGSSLETAINRRRQEGSMVAKGDNCSGPPDFQKKS